MFRFHGFGCRKFFRIGESDHEGDDDYAGPRGIALGLSGPKPQNKDDPEIIGSHQRGMDGL